MRIRLRWVVFVVLAAPATLCAPRPARADVRTVDFDDISGSGVRPLDPDRYEPLGVRFSTSGAGLFVFGPSAVADTPPNWIYGSDRATGDNGNASVAMEFLLPTGAAGVTSDVSFAIADAEAIGTWTASSFDINGVRLERITGAGNDRLEFTAQFPGTADIHRVEFTPSPDFEGIDTLRFEAPIVPIETSRVALFPSGGRWKFLHPIDGVDPATTDADFHTTWFAADSSYDGPEFDRSGPAPLGYGDITLRAVRTIIGTPPSGQRHTAYFKTTFELDPTFRVVALGAELLADDGAFIYVNGTLAATHNLPAGATDTYLQSAVAPTFQGTNTEEGTFLVPLDAELLVEGVNEIAVSLHNAGSGSSDLAMDLELIGIVRIVPEPGGLPMCCAAAVAIAAGRRRRDVQRREAPNGEYHRR